MDRSHQRTLIAHVEDRPGVLNRVASLFRRRAYNIESLTVGGTETPGVSRMTIVMEADDDAARRVVANLHKLPDVLLVEDLSRSVAVVRMLALFKVRATGESRRALFQAAEALRARVVDVAAEAVVVELSGTPGEVDSLFETLQPFGIIEMVRTGAVAMGRAAELPALEREGVLASGAAEPAMTPATPTTTTTALAANDTAAA